MEHTTTLNGSLRGYIGKTHTMSGNVTVPTDIGQRIEPATDHSLGGIIVGEDLQITSEGVLSVQKATEVTSDNTHPITAAAVYTIVGNIDVLLSTI